MNQNYHTEHKKLKTIETCPKCGNTKGLICIPGSSMTFYYCPKCYENCFKKDKTEKVSKGDL